MCLFLKPCTGNDLGVLRRISVETFRRTYARWNTPEDMAAYLKDSFSPDRLREELSRAGSRFYLLYDGDIPAGYLKLNEAPDQTDINDPLSLEIERIYILPAFQGRGYGTLLLSEAARIAAGSGKRYLWLGVWEKNEKAIRFYLKNGFSPFDSHRFVLGNAVQTDLLLRSDTDRGSIPCPGISCQ